MQISSETCYLPLATRGFMGIGTLKIIGPLKSNYFIFSVLEKLCILSEMTVFFSLPQKPDCLHPESASIRKGGEDPELEI